MLKIRAKGLDHAIKVLEAVPDNLEEKAEELAGKLGEYGKERASYYFFREAPYAGEIDDMDVRVLQEGKKATVIADGTAVLFIEFGTGVTMPDAEEARGDIKSGSVLRHGQFGRKLGANPNGWYFPYRRGDVFNITPLGTHPVNLGDKFMWKTRGNPAMPAVYISKMELMDESERIVREVFGK